MNAVSPDERPQTAIAPGAEADAPPCVEPQQLSFFDAVVPATMITTNPPCAGDEEIAPTVTQATDAVAPVVATEPASMPAAVASDAPAVVLDESLGQRMRAAREARGWSCEQAAHRLRFPVTVIHALEAERYERIGCGVYLRGYLGKYLQLLDLPLVLADRVLKDFADPPPLVSRPPVSRPRYLLERYSRSALYLILTGVIVVPAVLLATRGGFDSSLVHIAPLDAIEPPTVIAPAT